MTTTSKTITPSAWCRKKKSKPDENFFDAVACRPLNQKLCFPIKLNLLSRVGVIPETKANYCSVG